MIWTKADEDERPPSTAVLSAFNESRPFVIEPSRLPRINPTTRSFRRKILSAGDRSRMERRHRQAKNRIRSYEQLDEMLVLSDAEREGIQQGGALLPLGITPYYMSLLDRTNARQGLLDARLFPRSTSIANGPAKRTTPLSEDGHSPVPALCTGIRSRLFLVLDYCTTYCCYCTRSRVGHGEITASTARLERALDYIRQTPTIRDVLLRGDPLSLKDEKLEWILARLREIRHVEFVRIGTKMPGRASQRITPELDKDFKRYHPLWMSLHLQSR